MSRRQYVEALKLTREELRSLPPGVIVQVSLGMGERRPLANYQGAETSRSRRGGQ
ncbi:hypothetical protein ABZ938_06045 [Streptomyces sp. NPDC046409]|uniref:hypothetical protein n=1 Tax=Streptomyces sp. NPDC046409 TaxID=3156675 RepID=UPI0033E236CF